MPDEKTAVEIIVGANGSIFNAPIGSTVPTGIDVPLSADWVDLGYASEDGVKWTDGKTVQEIKAWQSFYPVRRINSERQGMIAYALMQWNGDTVKLAYGGGSISETSPGNYEYLPPDPSELGESMQAVEWQDGAYDFRLIFPRGMVTENVETNLVRTAASLLPITFALLGDAEDAAYRLQTNHPAFAAAVGS